ncbi:MAG: DUF4124 domain-containing protein [Gammaproteobacteria bacterium]
MKCIERLLLSAALVAGGFLLTAHAAHAAGQGIPVYTWTDANGITHFSDAPRKGGPAKLVVVPTPPPPNATVLAANQAWVAALDRDTQARLARDAAQRRAETESEAAIAAQQTEYATQSAQYVPLYLPVRHYHHGRNRYGNRGSWNSSPSGSASFPQYSLPSSFPPGLPSSFPETQNSSLEASPPR